MEQIFIGFKKNKKGEMQLTDSLKNQFFDSGASLLLYGSKRLYRQYLFFREFTNNPLIKQCKYFQEDLILYIMSDILLTMRMEVGLNSFNNIHNYEALGFFVNDITSNPIAKKKALDAKFHIKMIKFELFIIDRIKFMCLKSFFIKLIKPWWGIITIIFKHMVMIPFGRILMKLFPNFAENVQKGK